MSPWMSSMDSPRMSSLNLVTLAKAKGSCDVRIIMGGWVDSKECHSNAHAWVNQYPTGLLDEKAKLARA